jgi:SAM-dependent methyltransferase
MTTNTPINLWDSPDHARDYLRRADSILHRSEGESTLLEFLPRTPHRILDLGTGDGRLLALVKTELSERETAGDRHAKVEAVAVDFSPAMLEAARKRFAGDSSVTVVAHNLDQPLPALGRFDAVVSCFAIHHLLHERKRTLYAEIHALLNSGGVFCNLEHVASPTPRLHEEFLRCLGITPETEDPSNKLLDLETQLQWLREIGFVDVDCHWKWRELALLVGRRLTDAPCRDQVRS